MLFQRLALSALTASLLLMTACGGGSDGPITRGAIAVSTSTGKAAFVWNANNQNEANDAARNECGGGDCQVVLQFAKCGALSSATNGFIYAVAEGETAAAAQQAADSSCSAKGGQSCGVSGALQARCNG
ncbi:DUF4189 domain-containing protein [Hydrogenophaga sp. RWCD_12]|uniref:DUF4189 domain-containing protein n=1 Tax=Hydrogenophaga sp. RWCD_12 TaxID=3391190 RepID=UPI00398516B6